jgi:prepilin-type N-terminal cleavage/methylation domain-containing protein
LGQQDSIRRRTFSWLCGIIAFVKSRHDKSPGRGIGFTLIEMLVVLVVVGLLAGMAMSVWKKYGSKSRSRADFDGLHKALLLAKSDAITKNRHTGLVLDAANRKYLLFVDSSSTGAQDGQYLAGERILRNWTALTSDFKIHSVASSLSPQPSLRKCGAAPTAASIDQSGSYSIVLRPTGTAWASLALKAGSASIATDTVRLYVIQASGLVYKAK